MGIIAKKITQKCQFFSNTFGIKFINSDESYINDKNSCIISNKDELLLKNEVYQRNAYRPETRHEKYSKYYISQFIEMNLLSEEQKRNTVKENKNSKLSLNDFEILKLIGAGSFGKVFLVKEIKNNSIPKLFAMKILEKDKIIEFDQVQNTLTEREILEKLSHPFISKLCYAFQDIQKLYLLTDFMPGGDLMHKLTSYGKLNDYQAKIYACEIFLALEFLHNNNIIFRDLKPENILIDKDGHIKLTDFGLSKKFTNSDCIINKKHKITFSICGTAQYIAPEVYEGMGYAQEIDWWSYGIVLYEMLTGKFPFKQDQKSKKIIPKVNLDGSKIKLTPEAKDLISKLLDEKVNQRLFDPKIIKQHKFFEGINWEDVYNKKYDINNTKTNNNSSEICEKNNIKKESETSKILEKNFDNKFINNQTEVSRINEQKERLFMHYRESSSSSFLNFSFCENEEIIA